MRHFILVLLIIATLPCTTSAKKILKEEDVRKSVLTHFPSVLSAIEAVDQRAYERQSALGKFDAKIKYETTSRTEGYYDGQYGKASIEKPLYYSNAKVYGQYRKSEGDFPIYENQLITRNDGETALGISVSLLRDSWIDAKRTTLNNAELDILNQEQQQYYVIQSVLQKSFKQYWAWIYNHKLKDEYASLFELANKRQAAIKTRIKNGDLPEIYITENLQYILQRQNQVIEAERDLAIQKQNLALYVRDTDGQVSSFNQYTIPETLDYSDYQPIDYTNDLTLLIDISPYIFDLDIQLKQIQNEISLYKNQNLPAVDLSYEYSQDAGQGSQTLQDESKIMLSISTPIERREQGGKINALESKKRQLELKRTLFIDQLKQELIILAERISAAEKTVKNSRLEIEAAQKMLAAEQSRFQNGDSDFFLLNIREQNLAKARIDNLKYKLDLKKSHIDYDALTMRL